MSQRHLRGTAATPKPPSISFPGGAAPLTTRVQTPATGAGGSAPVSIPIELLPARSTPSLALTYTHDSSSDVFGVGFGLGLPSISRRTDLGVPKYDDTDTFLGPGGDELTPGLVASGAEWVPDHFTVTEDGTDYTVRVYRARVNPSGERIERWTAPDGSCFWKVRGAHNGIAVYGRSLAARVADPESPWRVALWLLEEQLDTHGNRITFAYRQEDGAGWTGWTAPGGFAQRYVSQIAYGNYRPSPTADEVFAFEVLFDYGDQDLSGITPAPAESWPVRQDPLTSCRNGFPIQTLRLCRNIVVLNHLPPGSDSAPLISRIYALTYDENPRMSRLTSVTVTGCRVDGGNQSRASLPPVTYDYQLFDPQQATWNPLALDGENPLPDMMGMSLLADLRGEGLPGIVCAHDQALIYFPPLGRGRYGQAETVTQLPDFPAGSTPAFQLQDVLGDGRLSLLALTRDWGGYFYNRSDDNWEPYRPFVHYPRDATSPHGQWVDLDGDGREDLLVHTPQGLLHYQALGASGFAAPTLTAVADGFPKPDPADERRLVTFADVLGDGMSHCVSVSDGCVRVWPNLGYGRFAPSFVMGGSPHLKADLTLDRILLGSFCGNGRSDLLLVYPEHLELFPNEGGQSFGKPLVFRLPGGISPLDRVTLADVRGNGQVCLVLFKATSPQEAYFLDFCGGTYPNLMLMASTGLGGSTSFTYGSSTDFYLKDRAQGNPWLTRLASPVTVVVELIDRDSVTGVDSIDTCRYRDGYFDPIERQFRGFGYVETQNAEITVNQTFESRLTRSWHHLGALELESAIACAYREQYFQGDPQAPEVGPSALSPDLAGCSPETMRQAIVALAGLERHSEVYAVMPDGTRNPVPLEVESLSYTLDLVQPTSDGQFAGFNVIPREGLTLDYEGVAQDPTVRYDATLEWNAFGAPTLGATVAYPRRQPQIPAQAEMKIELFQTDYIDDTTPASYLVGIVWQSRRYELAGLTPSQGDAFSYSDLKDQATAALAHPVPYGSPFTNGPQSRLFGWTKTIFWNAAQAGPAPAGQCGPQALVYQSNGAVFPVTFAQSVYGTKVTSDMLREDAGYTSDGTYWWANGTTVCYAGPDGYFQPTSFIAPFETAQACTTIAYDQPYWLTAIQETSPLGYTTGMQLDYQALEPSTLTDENGVVTEGLYDPLGRLLVLSQHGEVQGTYQGSMELSHYTLQPPPTLDELMASPHAYLQGAHTYFHQQLGDSPPWVAAVSTRAYGNSPAVTMPNEHPSVVLTYLDGFGRTIEALERVEGAAVGSLTPGEWSWLSPVRVDHDEQGRVRTSYLPAVLPSYAFEAAGDRPYSRHTYDALDREVRTDEPKGFFTQTEFTNAWTTHFYDENDTIKVSVYYQKNNGKLPPEEQKALDMAVGFYDTPAAVHHNAEGVVIQTDQINVDAQGQKITNVTVHTVDIRGLTTAMTDPRGVTCHTAVYDMLERPLQVKRADAGEAYFLYDATHALVHRWTALGDHVQIVYDTPERRPLYVIVNGKRAVSFAWGTDASVCSVDRLVQINDQAGTLAFGAYDIDGHPTQTTRVFAQAVDGLIDWGESVPMMGEAWTQTFVYDPSGTVLTETCADGTIIRRTLYANDWLAAITVQTPAASGPLVAASGIHYTPNGQPAGATYAGQVALGWQYDPLTLERIRDQAIAGSTTLQDLTYTLDPVGNLFGVADAYMATAAPRQSICEFDALYQVTSASGWTVATGPTWQPYTETFGYDPNGNLTSLNQRPFSISASSNRAVPSSMLQPSKSVDTYFDAAGNLQQLESGQCLSYDYANQLATVTSSAGNTSDWYRYDKGHQRVRRRTTDASGTDVDTFQIGPLFIQETGGQHATSLKIQANGDDFMLVQGTSGSYQVEILLTDRLGSVVATLDSQAKPMSLASYTPFGNQMPVPDGQVDTLDFGFTGKERDGETGMSYFGARYYLPTWGRWLTPDPLGEIDGPNLYQYVNNNPTTLIDPNGTVAISKKRYGPARPTGTCKSSKARARLVPNLGGNLYENAAFRIATWLPQPNNSGVKLSRKNVLKGTQLRVLRSLGVVVAQKHALAKSTKNFVAMMDGHRVPHADTYREKKLAKKAKKSGSKKNLSTYDPDNHYVEPQKYGEILRKRREYKCRITGTPVIQVDRNGPHTTLGGINLPTESYFIEMTGLATHPKSGEAPKSYNIKAYKVNYATFDYSTHPLKPTSKHERRRIHPLRINSLPSDVESEIRTTFNLSATEYPFKW